MPKGMESQTRPSRSVDEKTLEMAKQMFLDYASVSDISTDLGVKRTTLSYYANRYWKQERDLLKAELFSRFTETKRTNFIKMSESSIKIIQRALSDLADRENPPTVGEAKRATEILESLDKITRLDDGAPTEIVGEKPMDLKDIQLIAGMNPFNKEVEDAEYKELPETSKQE